MKKYPAYLLCVLLVLSSCGTNTHAEQGAATGAMFGSIFGSALGGILGGPRGSDIGTLTGMVGGAVLGASVGSAVDASEQRDRYPRGGYDRPQRRSANERTRDYDHPTRDYDNGAQGYDDGSGFDPTNSGDDRITFDASPSDGYPASGSDVYTTVQPRKADFLRSLDRTNKSSLVFSLPHEEGSLSQVLSILSFYKINMTKIQSLPIIGHEWEYMFYVDVTYDNLTRYRQSIDAITPLTKELKILGEYQDGKQSE